MSLPGPEPRDPALPGYEYLVQDFTIHGDMTAGLVELNDLGSQGWELICITNVITDDPIIRAWFMRPLQ